MYFQCKRRKSKEFNPATTISYVVAGDIDGVNYVSGSEGKPKIIREYFDIAKTNLLTTTTLKYQNSTYPTKVTDIGVV